MGMSGKRRGRNKRCKRRQDYERLECRRLLATVAIQNGDWHNPSTWNAGVPHSNLRAIVPQNISVDLDGTQHFAEELVIQGELNVPESPGIEKRLSTDWIHVNSGGVFQIGTDSNRYDANNFVIQLTGLDPNQSFNVEGVPNAITDNNGFLMVASGGELQFFGDKKTSFTKLAATAEPNSNQIFVESKIDRNFDGTINHLDPEINWQVGDQIVIASSSQNYEDEEVRLITGINDPGIGVIELVLDSPLNNRHYGQIESYSNDHRTYEIDMRAEVAVLNRSIRIEGTADQDTDNSFGDRARINSGVSEGFGGHTMIMASAGQVTIDNVQFDLMGQTGRLGRYPVHWHLAGDRTGDVREGQVSPTPTTGV